MNKKLLSSLMAALMLIPQGASLSAKNPVSEFVKNHKKIAVGGAGLVAGLAAGITYLVSTHNAGKVVELDSHALSLDDMTTLYNLDKSRYEKFLETVSKGLDGGLTLKVLMKDTRSAMEFSHRVYDYKTKDKKIPMDYKMVMENGTNSCGKVTLVLNQTKRIGKKLALECAIQKSKYAAIDTLIASALLQKFEREYRNDDSDSTNEVNQKNEENKNSALVPYFADYSEADPLRDYSNPAENGLKDFTAGV